MRQHDKRGAVQSSLRETEDAEHNEAQVADRRICDQLLHIWLHHCNQRAINNADQGQHHNPRGIHARLLRKESQVKPHHAVGTHFQKNASQQDGAGGRRFHVRIGKPCVKWKQRDLDGECDEESEKQQQRHSPGEFRDPSRLDSILHNHKIEAAGLCVEPQDCGQHEDRGDHCVQEKLYSGVNPTPVAINADQQGHWNQGGFPEEVKEKQIQGNENPNQACFEHQQQNEEFFDAVVNRVPRDQNAKRCQKSGQHHQPQGYSIECHVVVNVRRGNPLNVLVELESRQPPIKVCRQVQREDEGEEGNHQRKYSDVSVSSREEQQQQAACGRSKRDQCQNIVVEPVHRVRSPTQTI